MVTFSRLNTDTLKEQTKTKPQETLEVEMIKQMEILSFNPLIKLSSEKWLLAMISFGATISLFNITEENNSFSISKLVNQVVEGCLTIYQKVLLVN